MASGIALIPLNRDGFKEELIEIVNSHLKSSNSQRMGRFIKILEWTKIVYYKHTLRNIEKYSTVVVSYKLEVEEKRYATAIYTLALERPITKFGPQIYASHAVVACSAVLHGIVPVATYGYSGRTQANRETSHRVFFKTDSFEYKYLQKPMENSLPAYLTPSKTDDLLPIIDYFLYEETDPVPSDVTRLSYDQAVAASTDWHKNRLDREWKKALKAIPRATKDDVEILYCEALQSGGKIELSLLKSQRELSREGLQQHHCVASYWESVHLRQRAILRMTFGEETATLDVTAVGNPGNKRWPPFSSKVSVSLKINQMLGSCNKSVSDEMKIRANFLLSIPDISKKILKFFYPTQISTEP